VIGWLTRGAPRRAACYGEGPGLTREGVSSRPQAGWQRSPQSQRALDWQRQRGGRGRQSGAAGVEGDCARRGGGGRGGGPLPWWSVPSLASVGRSGTFSAGGAPPSLHRFMPSPPRQPVHGRDSKQVQPNHMYMRLLLPAPAACMCKWQPAGDRRRRAMAADFASSRCTSSDVNDARPRLNGYADATRSRHTRLRAKIMLSRAGLISS
jgi:hypothetical protein